MHSNLADSKVLPTLGNFLSVPTYARFAFIQTGYRKDHNNWDCFRSVFACHNETTNIWSSFFGIVFWLIIGWQLVEDCAHHSRLDLLVSLSYPVGCALSWVFIAIFHIFRPGRDEAQWQRLASLDFVAVSVVLTVSMIPQVYFVFYNLSNYRWFFSIICGSTALVLLHLPFSQLFHTRKITRVLIYTAAAFLFPALMAASIYYLEGNMTVLTIFYLPVCYSWATYMVGIIIYVLHFPEYLCPVTFDNLMNSHTLWHLLVVFAQYHLYLGNIGLAEHRAIST